MSTPSDKQRAEWLAILKAEHDRRQRKVKRQAEAADRQRDWVIDQIVQGERLLAGPDITDLVTELMVANGDRQRIEAIALVPT